MNTLMKKKEWKKIYRKNGMSPFGEIADFCRISTLRPFFGHFHIIKKDKSKNISGYGLQEYIDEEKRVKKKLQKKWWLDIWRNSRFLAEFQLWGHFLDTSSQQKVLNRKTSRALVLINTLLKKKEWKKITEKMARYNKTPPRPNFSNFWFAITRKLRQLE